MEDKQKPQDSAIELVELSAFTSSNIYWIWEDKIIWSMINLLVGVPGVGKSTAMRDIVARYTSGAPFPGQVEHGNMMGEVALLIGEESIESVTKPGLIAAGADISRIKIIKSTIDYKNATKTNRVFAFKNDMAALEKMLDESPHIGLIGVDPITDYIGMGVKSDSSDDVRAVLFPFRELCERRGVSALFVCHFNKSVTQNALDRISGSRAWGAIGRSTLMFSEDPESKGRHLMTWVKGNYARSRKGYQYNIVGTECVDGDIKLQTVKLVWGDEDERLANDVLKTERALSEDTRGGRARQWLSEYLTEPTHSNKVYGDGRENGYYRSALDEAKHSLKIESIKRGREWIWYPVGWKEPKNVPF